MLNLLNKYFCQFFLVIVLLFRLSDKVRFPSIEFHNLNTAISSKDKLIIDAHTTVFYNTRPYFKYDKFFSGRS